jgi:hypothetical protein
MLKKFQELFSPISMIINALLYATFIALAYHKVLLSKLGISEGTKSVSYVSTKDFWHQPVVERLGFGLIWGTMGMLAVAFIWLMVNAINDIQNARSLTRDYANVKDSKSTIYSSTVKQIAAGFSPLIIFPVCSTILLPLSYRLFESLTIAFNVGSLLSALLSALVGIIAVSLINLSFKLMRTAFS